MAEFTITVVPIGQRTDALECSGCGILPLTPHDDINMVVHEHLFGFHQCNPDTTEIRSD